MTVLSDIPPRPGSGGDRRDDIVAYTYTQEHARRGCYGVRVGAVSA